ncbi:MAG: hypothetical protein ACI4HM_01895 [Ruminococcus sp.]
MTTVGIDKIILYNFSIINISISELLEKHNIEITKASIPIHTHIFGEYEIQKIIIKDNDIFSDLIIGYTYSNNLVHPYTYLTLTVSNIYGVNDVNVSWDTYNTYIQSCCSYINAEYGIQLYYSDIKVKYIEFNCNIALKHSFSEYRRVNKLIMSLLPNYLKIQNSSAHAKKASNGAESLKKGNKSMEVVLYNKSAQLADKSNTKENAEIDKNIEPDIMRFELRLLSPEKVKRALGSFFWHELTDECIRQYFVAYFSKNIATKYNKWLSERQKQLQTLIKQQRKQHPKTWHHQVMQTIRNLSEAEELPYILDIEQIVSALSELPDPHRNCARSIRALLSIHIENDVYKKHDCDKACEIIDAVLTAQSSQPY